MTATAQILTAARALIEPPGSWCQGVSAVDDCGHAVDDLKDATKRCGLGAIWTTGGRKSRHSWRAEDILAQVARDRGFANFPKFNDSPATTHADVLAAFTAAIEKAKSV